MISLEDVTKAYGLLQEREQLIEDIVAVKGLISIRLSCGALPLDRLLFIQDIELVTLVSEVIESGYRTKLAALELQINELGVSFKKAEQTWEEFTKECDK